MATTFFLIGLVVGVLVGATCALITVWIYTK
jgi:gas vesicle protein